MGELPTMYTLSVSTAGLWIAVNVEPHREADDIRKVSLYGYKGCVSNISIIYPGNRGGVFWAAARMLMLRLRHTYKQVLWLLEA